MLRQGRTSSLEAEIWYLPEGGETLATPPYLEGPFSDRGRTLTARYPFQPAKLGDRDAWKLTLPEPVLWSPRSPVWYRLAKTDQVIGLRDIHPQHESFYLQNRRWLIRAASAVEEEVAGILPRWREADLVPIVWEPSSELCARALREGAALIADLTATPRVELAPHVARLSQFASVILMAAHERVPPEVFRACHSHAVLGSQVPSYGALAEGARFGVVSEHLLRSGWHPPARLPVVAARECVCVSEDPEDLRSHCDVFQANLRRGADYAGLWLFRTKRP